MIRSMPIYPGKIRVRIDAEGNVSVQPTVYGVETFCGDWPVVAELEIEIDDDHPQMCKAREVVPL